MTGVSFVSIVVAVVLLSGVFIASAHSRLGLPAMVGFVALGCAIAVLDPDVMTAISPDVATNLSSLALAMILFDGGLHTTPNRVRRAFWPAMSLATLGVLAQSAIMTALAHAVLRLPWLSSAMLGVAASSTDAASVFSALGNTSLKARLADVLEVESGTNDPMTFFLMTVLIDLARGDPRAFRPLEVALLFAAQMGIGLGVGLAVGYLGRRLLAAARLDAPGLYPAVTLAMALLSFGVAQSMSGSGFLSVYLTGVWMAGARMRERLTVLRFHEGLAWIVQIVMFVVLGFFLVPRDFADVAVPGVLLACGAIFVARPAAVWLSTLLTRMSAEERWFIAWAGLRGAAPIVLILFAVEAHVQGYIALVEVVFFVVIASALVQGTTVERIAETFALIETTPTESVCELLAVAREAAVMVPIEVRPGSPRAGKRLRDLAFPPDTLCYAVVRGGKAIVPRGSTRIRAGDHLLVLADEGAIPELEHLFREDQVGHAEALP
ncbi:potassium/proton antiporter [Alicyclobacillus sendaiensis]|uniref:Potassium/proton antiporter n=1 Tax=Alicyclobacillus sendaiensis PA2 TaxID=3029425 RepID=A0ABT6XXI4_ALISE|nr:potassium/proton antiporter [Alicyclobacillus sendaiensis]MDI9259808.1 potassium/proton antiporter [Alicyclobacillus sendaiensis PA2]